jgi:energy-coupling factor transport system ATP-binding protein
LELAPGHIVGVVGANEAGKSDAVVSSRPGSHPGRSGGELTSGTVDIDGSPTTGRPLYELATHVGIGFQNPETQLSGVSGSVFEEVALGPMDLGLPARETVARTKAALATLASRSWPNVRPGGCPGGQGQLVVLASLLAMRPPYLILDEPTAQLDPEGTRLVGEALRRLAGGPAPGCSSPSTRPICSRTSATVSSSSTAAGSLAEGPAEQILSAPALEGHGVEPPTRRSGWSVRWSSGGSIRS